LLLLLALLLLRAMLPCWQGLRLPQPSGHSRLQLTQ
jgi:hypothetical protein